MNARHALRAPFGTRPSKDPAAETWVQRGNETSAANIQRKGDLYTARLTIDVTPELRARIKLAALRHNTNAADLLRELLEREFPSDGGSTAP